MAINEVRFCKDSEEKMVKTFTIKLQKREIDQDEDEIF